MSGRPRTEIGTFGEVRLFDLGGRYRAFARFRDLDGLLRRVTATARCRRTAEALLKRRLRDRTGFGTGGLLSLSTPARGFMAGSSTTSTSATWCSS
ncbi:MAG: hypothetical protein ACXV5Q_00200 [Frankiaceae bacterium]